MSASVSLSEITRVFARIGLLSFGGPAAQIALMHRELVEARPWLSEAQFLRALSFCMLLPGPEAMQLCTYCGWRLKGVAGGLIAGTLFVLPGALVIFALAALYARFGDVPLVQALFLGIKATVLVIVAQALWKLAKKALGSPLAWALAGLSFAGLFAFGLPFPVIILVAGLVGALALAQGAAPTLARPRLADGTRTLLVWGALWAAPLVLLWGLGQDFLLQIGLFFSKLAVVTFGGAYAVLAYMTQEVVVVRGWLETAQMMDALGLAETTPGPLILVTQFVGILAGTEAGGLPLGLIAGLLTLWVTFVPCFLWIFLGAPWIDWISDQPRLTGALQGITAAVVGVIANLALWFSAHVLFGSVGRAGLGPVTVIAPDPASLSLAALGLAGLAAALLWGLRLPLPAVLGLTALAGGALELLLPALPNVFVLL